MRKSEHPLYVIWVGMIQRCTNQRSTTYRNYGGRGIRVCPEWLSSLEAFAQHMGPRPSPKHSIDRIDVNGHYEPGNVRWATPQEQQRNRRDNHLLTLGAETMTLAEWAVRLGIPESRIRMRLAEGWSVEKTLMEPRVERGDRCVNGHPLEGDNLVLRTRPTLVRRCRACANAYHRASRRRKKEARALLDAPAKDADG